MTRLPKYERAEQRIIKEFVPIDRNIETSAGRLIVRADNYGSSLAKFDMLFNLMVTDALLFESPIVLERDDVEVVRYRGQRYARTFGLEASIPDGHVIPDEYTRLNQTEETY